MLLLDNELEMKTRRHTEGDYIADTGYLNALCWV